MYLIIVHLVFQVPLVLLAQAVGEEAGAAFHIFFHKILSSHSILS